MLPELRDAAVCDDDASDEADAAVAVGAVLDADTAVADVATGELPVLAFSTLGVLGVCTVALLSVDAVSDTAPVPLVAAVADEARLSLLTVVAVNAGDAVKAVADV